MERTPWIFAGVALAIAGLIAGGAMGWTLLVAGLVTLLFTAAA